MSGSVNKVNAVNQAELNAHTEQALVELVYIRTANDMLGGALGSLDSALATTNSILNLLAALQNLKNAINIKSNSAFAFNYLTGRLPGGVGIGGKGASVAGTGPSVLPTRHTLGSRITANLGITNFALNVTNYQQTYKYAASTFFGRALNPFFVFSSANDPGFATFSQQLTSLKTALSKELQVLTKQTPASQRNNPDSLLGALSKVIQDLPTNTKDFGSVEKWVVDNYGSHGSTTAGSAGALENDLTFAITAAQHLNDSQKEKVRRFLFIFQEYYQSASAVITGINQAVQMMAQKISQ